MRIELKNVKKKYSAKMVLDIDNLELDSGKIYAVMGPNGSGKTTLLRIVAGIDRDYSGAICFDGVEKQKSDDIAYMPQSTYLFDLTAVENVILGIDSNGINKRDALNRAKHALSCVGMDDFVAVKARSLSGGESQRVALARTLVLAKSVVLLDEPASATDISGIEMIERYIKASNGQAGSTIVFTTHNPSQAVRLADEVIMMYNGRAVERGIPSSVINSPQMQETKDFLKSWRI